MLPHVLIIAAVTARDCVRRPSVLLVGLLGVAAMLSLRWLSIAGIGDELALLKEFGIANLTLGGAICAALCAAPIERPQLTAAADRSLSALPIGALALPLGRCLGALAVSALLWLVWSITLGITILWFADVEPALFTMRGATSAGAQAGTLAVPALLALVQTALLCAVAVSASGGGLPATAGAVFGVLILGAILPNAAAAQGSSPLVQAAAWLIPDLRYYSPGETFAAPGPDGRWLVVAVAQAAGYGGAWLAAASWWRTRG